MLGILLCLSVTLAVAMDAAMSKDKSNASRCAGMNSIQSSS